jgi:hypothetical protein
MRAMAEERGIDLADSWAYSDSVTDVPMLEAVGHPVVVNPDRGLLKVARAREWEVRRFTRPVRLRERVSMPKPGARAAAAGSGVAVVAAAVVVWWWLRRTAKEPEPEPYASRSFLAAIVPRATRRASSRSFFMAAR